MTDAAPESVHIQAINLAWETALSVDGVMFAFTDWIDEDGDECDKEDAVIGVATDGVGWICIDLREFTRKLS